MGSRGQPWAALLLGGSVSKVDAETEMEGRPVVCAPVCSGLLWCRLQGDARPSHREAEICTVREVLKRGWRAFSAAQHVRFGVLLCPLGPVSLCCDWCHCLFCVHCCLCPEEGAREQRRCKSCPQAQRGPSFSESEAPGSPLSPQVHPPRPRGSVLSAALTTPNPGPPWPGSLEGGWLLGTGPIWAPRVGVWRGDGSPDGSPSSALPEQRPLWAQGTVRVSFRS